MTLIKSDEKVVTSLHKSTHGLTEILVNPIYIINVKSICTPSYTKKKSVTNFLKNLFLIQIRLFQKSPGEKKSTGMGKKGGRDGWGGKFLRVKMARVRKNPDGSYPRAELNRLMKTFGPSDLFGRYENDNFFLVRKVGGIT